MDKVQECGIWHSQTSKRHSDTMQMSMSVAQDLYSEHWSYLYLLQLLYDGSSLVKVYIYSVLTGMYFLYLDYQFN